MSQNGTRAIPFWMGPAAGYPAKRLNDVAGMAGLEPADEGVKVPCLTTWLHPCIHSEERRRPEQKLRPSASSVGWVKGLEPSTPGTTIRCSNQLSYTHHMTDVPIHLKPAGTPGGTRTPGPLLRRQLLYPPELQARFSSPPKSEPSAAGPIWEGAARNERACAIRRKPGIWSLRRRWSG